MSQVSGRPTTLRPTRQRRAITESLQEASDFQSAQDIHDALRHAGEKVGLATVYRTLQAMAESGEVDVLQGASGEAVYRRCSTHHHHHLVCRTCGRTVTPTSWLPSSGVRLVTVNGASASSCTLRTSVARLPAASRARTVSVWLPGARWARSSTPSNEPIPRSYSTGTTEPKELSSIDVQNTQMLFGLTFFLDSPIGKKD